MTNENLHEIAFAKSFGSAISIKVDGGKRLHFFSCLFEAMFIYLELHDDGEAIFEDSVVRGSIILVRHINAKDGVNIHFQNCAFDDATKLVVESEAVAAKIHENSMWEYDSSAPSDQSWILQTESQETTQKHSKLPKILVA